jgi:NADH dehydrogenase FAD-containing subunit
MTISAHSAEQPHSTSGPPPRIVVVGRGAAGLELVTRLGDTLGKRGEVDISLIERERTHLLEASTAYDRGR